MSAVFQRLREKSPHKPYCTNDLAYGVCILPKNIATLIRFTQQNQPHALHWLPFDVDRIGTLIDWNDQNCPVPDTTVKNPRNGRMHLLYMLALPVRTAPDASASTPGYAAAIERALCGKLGADVNYSGLIRKNSYHPEWQEVEWREEPYTLDELADYPGLSASVRRNVDKNYGLGRNYHLLERARKRAYKVTCQDWPISSQWLDAVTQRVEMCNTSPLALFSPTECRVIGKSIARYTHRKFSPRGFSAVQVAQGRKGGTKSECAAAPTSARSLEPWGALGTSRATHYRKLKRDPDLAK